MKLLRSSDFHRDFLSVEFFKGPYLVHSDETLEKFDLSSIFSKCGIFQRSTLSTFSMKPLRRLVFHRYFLSVEFFRGSHLVHFRWNLEKFGLSSIFSKCGIFQRSTLTTFSMKPLGVWSFFDIFKVWNFPEVYTWYISMKLLKSLIFHRYFLSVEFFRGPHSIHFRWNFWEVRNFIDVF